MIATALCAAQILGSSILVIGCCIAFLVLVFTGCIHDFTLPITLFFLPWSPILRFSQDSFSFYTVGLVMIAALNAVKNWHRFKRYHITAAILLLLVTLLSKLIDGSSLSLDYICFIMMIAMFPLFREENTSKKYDFYGAVVFLSAGIIIAALCAQQFASYSNIAKYIRVHSYSNIVRRCGFYGDPNFYTAQITAALSGCLALLLYERVKARSTALVCLALLLLYCGFLSGSKSFLLVSGVLVVLWLIELLKMRGRSGLKIALIFVSAIAVVYITTSALFSGLIDVIMTRFSSADDLDGFTTGRIDLWASYLDTFINDLKVLLLGKGYTNINVNGRGSHNLLIQMLYQFGLIGMPVLLFWIVQFWRKSNLAVDSAKINKLCTLMLCVGSFLPWAALDLLFFDEFFFLQWYCLMGIQALKRTDMVEKLPDDEGYLREDDAEAAGYSLEEVR